jgi:hypothetical protein
MLSFNSLTLVGPPGCKTLWALWVDTDVSQERIPPEDSHFLSTSISFHEHCLVKSL